MNFGAPTGAVISNFVWTASTRSLTNLGCGVVVNSINQSLAASGTASFSPGGALFRMQTVGLKAGAAGTFVASFSDGTNLFQIISVASGQTGAVPFASGTVQGFVSIKNNDAANPATYSIVTLDITP